jgi:hypothetical protein
MHNYLQANTRTKAERTIIHIYQPSNLALPTHRFLLLLFPFAPFTDFFFGLSSSESEPFFVPSARLRSAATWSKKVLRDRRNKPHILRLSFPTRPSHHLQSVSTRRSLKQKKKKGSTFTLAITTKIRATLITAS